MSKQITTITFFKYANIKDKFWAFTMMQFAHRFLKPVNGMLFYKLMGSGKGLGFNPLPDWSVYSLLQIWESEQAATHFFKSHELVDKYKQHSSELWTIYLKNKTSVGFWSGVQPFKKSLTLNNDNQMVAVITRATIKWNKLLPFWRYASIAQKPIKNAKGLIYTKGIGEVPLVQMCTFSIWENTEALKKFAYRSEEHQLAIKKTRALQWYKEELFARFQPYKSIGVWEGKNQVPQIDFRQS